MKIFAQEIADNLAEKIQADTTVAYCAPVVLAPPADNGTLHKLIASQFQTEASANPNQIDLYYLSSILVSTGWNKNDDVFDPSQTWAARHTPEDKQFNFMHNENDIIGHITECYVVTKDGNKVAADAQEPPTEFDIITQAVLYNSWSNPENRDRMKKIIAEIQQGKWFVSMECLFSGFDYAITDNNGLSRTIARSEESSFLTKHLRAYGGTGEYEGYKIGRSLREISFSGKGLVSKPANPRSIILDSSKAFSIGDNVSSTVSKGDSNMSSETEVEKQLDLPSESTPVVENVSLETKADTSALEAALAEKETAIQAYVTQIATLEDSVATLKKELDAVTAEMQDMKKKEKMAARKSKLMCAEFDETEAEEALKLYDSLDDVTFEAILAMYQKKNAKAKEPKPAYQEDLPSDEKEEMYKPKGSEAVAEESNEQLFDGVSSTGLL